MRSVRSAGRAAGSRSRDLSLRPFFPRARRRNRNTQQDVERIGIPIDDALLRPILSSPVEAFCIAAAGALSSSAFVLPVLKQKGWEERPEVSRSRDDFFSR